MIAIALRTLRARRAGFAGAFIASMLAVTLVGAWAILFESGSRAQVPPERLAGSPVMVAAKQKLILHTGHGDGSETSSALMPERVRLDPDVLPKLAAVHGVRSVVPDVSAQARAYSGAVTADVQAHGWNSATLTPYTLVSGRAPAHDDEIAVDRTLDDWHIGNRIHLQTATGDREYTVSGVIRANGVRHDPPAVFTTAARIAAIDGYAGRIDAVGVFPDKGTSVGRLVAALRAAQPQLDVLTGNDRGKIEFPDAVQSNSDISGISASIAGIAVLVAVFVTAGTLSVSIQQRSREIALLRAVAATPRQVRRMISAETLLVSVAAVIAGIGPAIGMAAAIRAAFVHKGILQPEFRLYIGWIALVATAGCILVAGQLAAFIAGRRAAKVHPTTALAESTAQPHRLGVFRILLGLIALGGGITLMTVSMSAAGDGAAGAAVGMIMVFMVAVGLLGPIVCNVGAAILGQPIRSFSRIGGFLAVVHARSRSRRLASAMTPVTLCVALAFITLVLQATISHAEVHQSDQRIRAGQVVRAAGPGIPEPVVAKLRAAGTAIGVAQTQVESPNDLTPYDAAAVTPGPLGQVLDLDVRSGTVDHLQPGEVALSEQGVPAFHARLGGRIELHLGDGTTAHPRVVGIFGRGLGFGDVLLPWSTVSGHLTTPALSEVYLRSPASDPGAEYPGLRVSDRTSYRAQVDRDQQLNAWVNDILLGTIAGFVAVAVANTFVMTMLERRREFALLRLVGATSVQVLRMVRWEAALVLVLGLGLGTVIGVVTMVPFCRTLGEGVSIYIPPVPALVLAAGAILLAVLASLLATRKALRQAPIEAIGLRE